VPGISSKSSSKTPLAHFNCCLQNDVKPLILYCIVFILMLVGIYMRIQKPKEVPVPEKNLSVAVFTTSAP
jgi:hypothetical protein